MLSETNLTADISNAEVGLLNHKIYRKDHSNETSDRVRGGGIIVAADKDIPSFEVSVSTNPIESVFVLISLNHGFKTLINGVYIQASQPLHVYQAYYKTVEDASALMGVEAHSLLISDFNLLGVNSA